MSDTIAEIAVKSATQAINLTNEKFAGTPVGNAAAMREALKSINMDAQFIYDHKEEPMLVRHRADRIERTVIAALSSPPRNCDRFYVAEKAIMEWQRLNHMKPNTWDFRYNYWLFAPAKKGADDE